MSNSAPPGTRDVSLEETCRRLLAAGNYLGVCEQIEKADADEDRYLAWLYARALARCAPELAEPLLARLEKEVEALASDPRFQSAIEPGLDPSRRAQEEVLGLRARCEKSSWEDNPADRSRLIRAYQAYRAAYLRTGQYWTGINAATLGSIAGKEHARAIAIEVQHKCTEIEPSYWQQATIAEAALVLGDVETAGHTYRLAVERFAPKLAERLTTRHNARALLRVHGRSEVEFDRAFQIPNVAVFSGHMIDRADRPEPRFPASAEPVARRAIEDVLARYDIGVGFAAAACGADILFHEALLARGGEPNIVLPQNETSFRRESVLVGGTDWGRRFDELLATVRARFGPGNVVTVADTRVKISSVSYDFANRVAIGLARSRHRELETELYPIVLWDGKPGDDAGGTSTVARRLLQSCGHLLQLDPLEIVRGQVVVREQVGPAEPGASLMPASKYTAINAILFADVAGFSQLSEDQNPAFVAHFMGLVARVLAEFSPVVKNTWGDGLYVVFSTPEDAARFALTLRDRVRVEDWQRHGLPARLGLRIGLHAGPGYIATDPVTKTRGFVGGHVSFAARIEPVVLENAVFASMQFIALASEIGASRIRAVYAGLRELPKLKRQVPLWRLEWK